MTLKSAIRFTAAALLAAISFTAAAQQGPLPYGTPISLADAKKAAAAAEADARNKSFFMAIAIVGPTGELVYFEKMDNTQIGSIKVALGKARSAAQFRRPTKVFQDLVAKGDAFTYLLGLEGAVVVQGGIPIVKDGKIVGAIGVSGGTGPQDSEVAEAGLAALK